MKIRRDTLIWGAMTCALVGTFNAEHQLAVACGVNEWIAYAVPGALDIYAVESVRRRRDVLAAVLAMIGVNATSYLTRYGVLDISVPVLVGVSAIAPLVLWRVHRLSTEKHTVPVAVTVEEHADEALRNVKSTLCLGCKHTEHRPYECDQLDGYGVLCACSEGRWFQAPERAQRVEVPCPLCERRMTAEEFIEHDCSRTTAPVPAVLDTMHISLNDAVLDTVHIDVTEAEHDEAPVLSLVPRLPAGFEDEHMARARVLDKQARAEGKRDGVPVRVLKTELSVGTPRAQSIKAVLRDEHAVNEVENS